jgi:hypothetical protein
VLESVPLGLKDVGVHLTTLALAPIAIDILSRLYSPVSAVTTGDGGGGGGGGGGGASATANSSSGIGSGSRVKKSPLSLISEVR